MGWKDEGFSGIDDSNISFSHDAWLFSSSRLDSEAVGRLDADARDPFCSRIPVLL